MRVLVVGGLGSIGSRYVAILKHLGHEPYIYDVKDKKHGVLKDDWDKAIIATPTKTHHEWCRIMYRRGRAFLCEKPLSKSLQECQDLAEIDSGYLVCNYRYLIHDVMKGLSYNYYKTGNDGLLWDLSQIVYLHPRAEIRTDSPVWKFYNGDTRIAYEQLEKSYVKMVDDFVSGNTHKLWTMKDGLKMTKAVLERECA